MISGLLQLRNSPDEDQRTRSWRGGGGLSNPTGVGRGGHQTMPEGGGEGGALNPNSIFSSTPGSELIKNAGMWVLIGYKIFGLNNIFLSPV